MLLLSHPVAKTLSYHHCCLATPFSPKVPSVKEAVSLEAEDHLGLSGFGLYRKVEGECLCWLGSVSHVWWMTFQAPKSSPTPGQKGPLR